MKNDIQNRKDLVFLVHNFYKKVIMENNNDLEAREDSEVDEEEIRD